LKKNSKRKLNRIIPKSPPLGVKENLEELLLNLKSPPKSKRKLLKM
jgi:hypothetical protein